MLRVPPYCYYSRRDDDYMLNVKSLKPDKKGSETESPKKKSKMSLFVRKIIFCE